MHVLLLDVEGRVLEQFLNEGLTFAEADGWRRFAPVHRDLFDNFLFIATTPAVGEGTWARFPTACTMYLSAVGGDLQRPPPLIPPEVAATVAEVLSQFRRTQPGDKFVEGLGRITEHQYQLAEQLFYGLGGDLGDGLWAAGLRVYSKMMSARISDGFVHPALGGHLWHDVPAGPPHLPDSGRDVTILDTIEALSQTWRTSRTERPRIERTILDHAHTLGWTEDPGRALERHGASDAERPPTGDGLTAL
ncbi:hypothetical protein CBI38_29415 [Rhodococcus oxybenzonivorans]|uniref:Uncharacterized protein n=1 Tax=Rhodococcus oxybenzonivorans TaxID=1990687 RepID=A0A2S2C2Q0_9NOCA|nr:hypothetical protein [Rhodococcus oxybenzonivorans]AWK75058.1 hypothetical protein CBI38_29415 [Rhodococcus oxybenzonivorans]